MKTDITSQLTRVCAFLCLIMLSCTCIASTSQTAILRLKQTIKDKKKYELEKETKIANLKKIPIYTQLEPIQFYELNKNIGNEYEKFQTDSAIVYWNKNIEIATQLNNKALLNVAKINIAPLYSSTGKYLEALETLKSINRKELDNNDAKDYYFAYSLAYSHYGQSSGDLKYHEKPSQYRDSLLCLLDKSSIEYAIRYSEKIFYNHNDFLKGREILAPIFDTLPEAHPQYATLSYLLGYSYDKEKNLEMQKYYYAKSATSDIENVTKDNASLLSLAISSYRDGNLPFAQECSMLSIEDAHACNVRYRTMDTAIAYPLISKVFNNREQKQKHHIFISLILISVLLLFLLGAVIYIYNQVKRLSKTRKALGQKNEQLKELNINLKNVNLELKDANQLKEEYITYSFDIYSSYISKIESFTNKLHNSLKTNKMNELVRMISTSELVNEEKKEFYNNFDNIFLAIYPNFVEEFNNLLVKEERFDLKNNEKLNTELRVFALIRLGINDSNKIASYLHCSLSTIYNYRAKIRSKSAVPRDEFESYVSRIGAISQQ